ncbi:complex I intermediate-associated protein CIA30 [Coprinopsis marcescibilis]|uniref:Complex I intermediate-associated protein CIA30 n=1 Tax=Coprinopsis marcescibilis TaxID=230819 RepID=A0A5C3L328_COPMA|nr:complex I intermediate-associated protein CIA30 [Coprinopsis marcescibilis]
MSHWSRYIDRSARVVRDGLSRVILMQGADVRATAPKTLYTFHTQEDIDQFATGCDGDIGGSSTVHLDLETSPEINAGSGQPTTAKFHGSMRLDVKPGFERKIRGGYAGFRNKNKPSIFGNVLDDLSGQDYLALRLRLSGDLRTRNSYFVNLQTDGPISTDLWQHRLYFRRNDGGWEDVFIPFSNFVRTNAGEMVESQIEMYRERVRSIGISLLGGNSGVSGKYELGLESIRAVNEEDVTAEPLQPSEKVGILDE